MPAFLSASPQRRLAVAVAIGAVLAATVSPVGRPASAEPAATGSNPLARDAANRPGEVPGYFDARGARSSAGQATLYRTASRAATGAATQALLASLPGRAVLDIDGTTGTVRTLARLDGFLTRKSSKRPSAVALSYVRAHHEALGLTKGDLKTFRLRRDYRDIGGVHHLYWRQVVGGEPVFGNGLTAAVTGNGRLLSVGGSPVSRATLPAAADLRIASSREAVADARGRLGVGVRSSARVGDTAQRVLFVTARGSRHAWMTEVLSVDHPAVQVVDAASGRLLYRNPLSNDAGGLPGDAQVFRNHPGASRGGKYVEVNFVRRGWLPAGATRLEGNNAHAYSDMDGDDEPVATEEIRDFDNKLVRFRVAGMPFCTVDPCSWNPGKRNSWRTNRAQNGTQVFYFVNQFHDRLLARPVGFTEAAGNFEAVNSSGKGKGGDPVQAETSDGAALDHGLPDADHVDGSSMSTPRDGRAPTMQLYLQHEPGKPYGRGEGKDPFPATNTGDEAITVYHEYAHGLSNRLVVDVQGNSTLGPVQGDAMGEGWSDWYAADALVSDGLEVDRRGRADLDLFDYKGLGASQFRTQGIDCTPSSPASACPQSSSPGRDSTTGHTGGYTYADFGKVVGGLDTHADGEIWAQTLWSLRDKVGSRTARSLVTRAMELAPADPSYLDVRNATLVADTAHFRGRNHGRIWTTFARRGMGFFAGSFGGGDASPAADRHTPPKAVTTGVLTGTVRDAVSGNPLAGVPVTLAFQSLGIANPTAVTAADGSYRLGPVPVGHYGKLAVTGAGFLATTQDVSVAASGSVADFEVRRDWAALSGGARIVTFNGPDYTSSGCGPAEALDISLTTGWSTSSGNDSADPTDTFRPKFLTVDLGRKIDISDFGVDPSANAACADLGSSSTGAFRIETSPDKVTWTVAASGTFTASDRGRLNTVIPTAGSLGVRYVRFRILGNQVPDFATSCPDGPYTGCQFTDLTELQVYGAPAAS